jgi:hypothetical protein
MCICPQGTVLKGKECVKVQTCSPRQILNSAGICVTPEPKRKPKPEKRPRRQEREDREEPRRQPRFDIDMIPGGGFGGGGFGGGGGNGRGGGGGGGESPGRR